MEDELPPFLQPTLDHEVQRLVAIYGTEALKNAVRRLAGSPRGRPEIEADEWLFANLIKTDAADWLEGRDPFKLRTNTAVAREYAQKQPGHDVGSTMRRIQRKLSSHRSRAVLVAAYILTGYSPTELSVAGFGVRRFPFSTHFRALEALAAGGEEYWREVLANDRALLEKYQNFRGNPPGDMTWREILDAPRMPRSSSAEKLLALPAEEVR